MKAFSRERLKRFDFDLKFSVTNMLRYFFLIFDFLKETSFKHFKIRVFVFFANVLEKQPLLFSSLMY